MRVKCIDNWFYEHLIKVGAIYEVLEFSYGYVIKPGVVIEKNKFEIIKEEKMENILKVGDKVVCIDDDRTEFLTKDKVYTVDKLDGTHIYLLEIKSSFSFNSRLFKKVDDKTPQVKIVRKLEELDGLDNGMGAKIYLTIQGELRVSVGGIKWFDPNVGGVGIEEVLKKLGFKFEYKPLRSLEEVDSDKTEEIKVIRNWEDLKGMENGFGLIINENLDVVRKGFNGYYLKREELFTFEGYLGSIKSMGFKFEYKPSKVVHEVIKEIKSLDSLTFKQGELNYFVSWCKGKYHVEAMRETFIIGVNYMTEEQAQKYADELNEIIKSK